MSDSVAPSKLALKLQKRLKEELGLDVEPRIHRNYPGYWQRSNSIWSWGMQKIPGGSVGSCYPPPELQRQK